MTIRPFTDADLPGPRRSSAADMAGRMQARLGVLVDALACPGIVAEADGEPVCLLTYKDGAGDVEIVYLQAPVTCGGIGTRLMEAMGADFGGSTASRYATRCS